MKTNSLLRSAALVIGLIGFSAVSFADSITYSTSVGTQPSDVGAITLTQVNATTVKVLLDLKPGYGILNTGGPHTPFAFNLAHEDNLSISFVQPSGGTYTIGSHIYLFSLNTGGGANTPYGTFGVAIDDSAPNGGSKAYYGDFEFNLSRTGGLTLADFVPNSVSDGAWFFSADLVSPIGATGAQAWKTKDTPQVPDSGATAILLGVGLLSLSLVRRKSA